MNHHKIKGLVVAAHTPFHADGSLNLSVVERQAEHFLAHQVTTVFVCGSTGESHSLTYAERRDVARQWLDVCRGSDLRVIVHVGANCLTDAAALAEDAQRIGAVAISALAPSYFKPGSVDLLVQCCAQISGAAPELPFYYYDIPALTGVNLPVREFLAKAADKLPQLVGVKFTNPDLAAYRTCLELDGGRWDIPWGVDEWMLGALAMGAQGAVGSGFNFAAPVYQRLLRAFAIGDWEAARREQSYGIALIETFAKLGYMGACKVVMQMLGVPVGPARLPNKNLSTEEIKSLEEQLERLDFFKKVAVENSPAFT